ncbi:unnamed protein product [Caretta caretta]
MPSTTHHRPKRTGRGSPGHLLSSQFQSQSANPLEQFMERNGDSHFKMQDLACKAGFLRRKGHGCLNS